jgi:hypothetical protein
MNIVLSERCSKMSRRRFEPFQRDRLVVHRDRLVRVVFQHDLVVVRLLHLLFGLERQVHVDALLRQREGRHEDDEQHEEHVDERRDVHVRTGVRDLAANDFLGAVV